MTWVKVSHLRTNQSLYEHIQEKEFSMIIQKPKAKKEKKNSLGSFFQVKWFPESTRILIFTQKDSNYN